MTLSRRRFLAGTACGGAAIAAAPAEARDNRPLPPKAVGLLFDSTLCVGCQACVHACKQANDMPAEFSTADQLWDTPRDLSGKTLNVIKAYVAGSGRAKDDAKDGFAFIKKSCLHCADPSCVSACPVRAMTKDGETGIVAYDSEACIGCRYCVAACPFGVPRFQYDRPVPQIAKCQLCRHRIKDGKYAACAEVCPTGATLYGPLAELKAEAQRRLAARTGEPLVYPRNQGGPHEKPAPRYVPHLYGDTELGGTQMLVLAGVPHEKLGLPRLPGRSYASQTETIQHGLYSWLAAPAILFGGLLFAARRSSAADDLEE